MAEALGQFRALVEGLYDQTLSGQRHWAATSTKNTYTTKIGGKSLEIVREVGSRGVDLWIIIYDQEGNAVDSFSDSTFGQIAPSKGSFDGYYSLMKELYDAAGRNARGADKAIAELLGEMGLEPLPSNDDIPF